MENTTLGPWSLYKPKTFPWAWIPAFTPEECKKIVEYGSSLDKFYGTAGNIEKAKLHFYLFVKRASGFLKNVLILF